MAFSPSFIEELKQRNNIEEVISRYVDLKRAGSNVNGLCPFHSERSPSFTVFPESNFYCFGCGAGGDVITFIMRIENLDYREAIEFLADRAGMSLPTDDLQTARPQKSLTRERNFLINKKAAKLFYKNLNEPDGREARSYLENRGLTNATMIHFGLGYAKNNFSDLFETLTNDGFTADEIKEAFLCGISKTGHPYDYFRNRIIFPIIDLSGNIVAFGGRVMDDSLPKYLNSSDTPVFKKSRTLFALNFAKNAILGAEHSPAKSSTSVYAHPGELILCEGYMDVISLHQAGFVNSVATLGTAITPEHARIMGRYAKVVHIAYDSDDAGKRAADKAIKLLTEAGVDCKVLRVTDGAKDPDEYIKKFGAFRFSKLLTGSVGQIDYRLNEAIGKYDLSVPDERLKAVSEVCRMLSFVFPEFKREIYVLRFAELTGVSKENIETEVRRQVNINKKTTKNKQLEETQNRLRHYNDTINRDAVKYSHAVEVEERILGIVMLYPEFLSECKELCAECFLTDFNKTLMERLQSLQESGNFDLSLLNEFYNPQEFARIFSMQQKRKILQANNLDILREQLCVLAKEKQKQTALKTDEMSTEEFFDSFEKLRLQKTQKKDT